MIHQHAFRNKKLWGWVVLLAGVIFFLQFAVAVLPVSLWNWLWPILIVIAGVEMVSERG